MSLFTHTRSLWLQHPSINLDDLSWGSGASGPERNFHIHLDHTHWQIFHVTHVHVSLCLGSSSRWHWPVTQRIKSPILSRDYNPRSGRSNRSNGFTVRQTRTMVGWSPRARFLDVDRSGNRALGHKKALRPRLDECAMKRWFIPSSALNDDTDRPQSPLFVFSTVSR